MTFHGNTEKRECPHCGRRVSRTNMSKHVAACERPVDWAVVERVRRASMASRTGYLATEAEQQLMLRAIKEDRARYQAIADAIRAEEISKWRF